MDSTSLFSLQSKLVKRYPAIIRVCQSIEEFQWISRNLLENAVETKYVAFLVFTIRNGIRTPYVKTFFEKPSYRTSLLGKINQAYQIKLPPSIVEYFPLLDWYVQLFYELYPCEEWKNCEHFLQHEQVSRDYSMQDMFDEEIDIQCDIDSDDEI
jgi:hypothetical protein